MHAYSILICLLPLEWCPWVTPQKTTLRKDILAGIKFGGFGGFFPKSGKCLIKSGNFF